MTLVSTRALLYFPPGDNSSDTIVSGTHYNLTTLLHWNYTFYSNNTFSNGSRCLLVFEPYTPHLLENGTFLNSTSCYSPIRPMQARSKIGLFFTVFFSISIVFTLTNLRKHGRLFLPTEKRFLPIGRRWQWYWMVVVGIFGIISSVTNVDVDRYYLPELPLVLSSFFWSLMLPTTMCIVWESVRHWGSWQERQMIDVNSFMLRQDDLRSKVELYLPLIFYFFALVNIFMVVPRSWGPIELQRDPEQARLKAAPAATDIRFKLGAFMLIGAWLTIIFSLCHSIKHYKPASRGIVIRFLGPFRYIPVKFMLTLVLSAVMTGYEAAYAFDFSISPLNVNTNLGLMYGLGWGTMALIFVVYEIAGYVDPNEDRELIRQRRLRNAITDRDIGFTKKPNWWSRRHSHSQPVNKSQESRKSGSDAGSGEVKVKALPQNVEMRTMLVSKKQNIISLKPNIQIRRASDLSRSETTSTGRPEDTPSLSSGLMARADVRSGSTSTAATLSPYPQHIRSMLDV